MPARTTNLGLSLLLLAAGGTGVLAFATGTPGPAGVVTLAHAVAGLGLLVLARPKAPIVARGWRRARGTRWAGALLGVVVVLTVVTGLAHAGGLRTLGPVTTMQVHVGAAVALIPAVLVHIRAHPVRPRRTDLSRRRVLRGGIVAGAAGALVLASELVWRATGAPGADRRATGSHEVGSFEPAAMPVTQWFTDSVPSLDPDSWRLTVSDGDGARELGLADLEAAAQREVVAIIDCTGGWYAEQRWSGVRLRDVVRPADGDRTLEVISVTGYRRRLPLDDLDTLLVATELGGASLSAGHGAPARLVAPGRRGFWWVKWITSITTDPLPVSAQPPFPLQ